MPFDLSRTLVVGVSSTALFELAEASRVFYEEGMAAYRSFMLDREDEPLAPGTGMPLVKALLSLNDHVTGSPPCVEVVVMSRNSPETGMVVMKAVRRLGLPLTRFAFTGGEPLPPYIEAFSVDLFLSTSESDVQQVVDSGSCAAALVYPPPEGFDAPEDQVRIAFDADAVLFREDSEIVYKTKGLEAFHQAEDAARDTPMAEGPYAQFLIKLARLQERLPEPVEYSPVRLSIVTARDAPAELRVITTLRHWGVYVDAAFFLGGVDKSKVLAALRPHIFFDDQHAHLESARGVVPSGRVPYASTSPLRANQPEQPERADVPSSTGRVPLSRSPADAVPG